jgi:hypothetical protein
MQFSPGVGCMGYVYSVNRCVQGSWPGCGLHSRHGGTEFLGTQKIKNGPDPRPYRFRPEPGFFGYRIFIG